MSDELVGHLDWEDDGESEEEALARLDAFFEEENLMFQYQSLKMYAQRMAEKIGGHIVTFFLCYPYDPWIWYPERRGWWN